ncbi:hypothetical protein CLAFUW4_11248 [Fulvia fulva]|nr:hypothetical protein CLAFUR4_11254 [Fulvia fulva]KAK4620715.1 hypothetical protein CLAFUR0_11259 [Fulvia fulva]WPV17568.1 hypothetical protein CLAFUW4_11248 [Fulvia fulva]WPV31902.1 hypothetical protein CLAFUW7_11244 [Fulvia fulva]
MGSDASSPAHTEGQIDGRPVSFYYKRADGDNEETKLSWTDGYKVYPSSTWHDIPAKSILAIAPTGHHNTEKADYHFLYVEDNPNAQDDTSASPVVFRSCIVTNPPSWLVQDESLPSGKSCFEFRYDRSDVLPNFHIVVSTGSGTGQAKSVWEQLVKPMLDYVQRNQDKPANEYQLHFTTSESSVADLTQDVLLPQADLGVAQSVLMMSGDGGIVDVVNTLLSSERSKNYKKPNLSVLPLGTGNALAHSSGITADNTLGLKSWFKGEPKELPLFAASFSQGARALFDGARQERELHAFNGVLTAHGAVVCSWGLHAGLVADSDTAEYRNFGAERFKMAAKEALFPSDGSPPHRYQGHVGVQRSGKKGWRTIRQGQHGYILATMVSQLEKGFTISPASKPLDAILRLIHFGPLSGEGAMDIMTKAYQGGQHVEDERVGYEEIEALRIEFLEGDARWRRVCIDGKIIRVEKGGWVEVRAGQKGVVDLIA